MPKNKEPYVINIDPVTMFVIVLLVIALPLILTGFLGQ